ncbi:ribosome-associated translation inhibitor RaiA [Roseomonas alkaliterrae]|uniref:Ribosome hibernation promoting factor n=1 Tax=Neoroseomonas alkaliterrae TaxID=1452450 RepID=A0A840XK69_9PROT|nr:ribosome-associated translation inhibitor RaiA [Neoroseomonas alkaliterrae]MBB5688928.1 ribosomal subunit interface protein [Neoroseomonas alkaliterrae]MBR0676392.1 ribosome-associated translation inhibitor RaiA [Neoroseomonas alkaliterrae]
MHVTVAGKQVDTGEALKVHVREGLDAITRKYFDHALEANVTFHKNRALFACDINLKAGRGLTMRAEGEGPDAHRAFDEAAEHLAKRLRRYRRRVNEHARSFAPEREAPAGLERVLRPQPEEEAEAPAPNGEDHGAIVAEHPAEIALLTVGEAVMRMDLAQVPVLMFRNKATRALNVVYRRADGNVGWIDPGAG